MMPLKYLVQDDTVEEATQSDAKEDARASREAHGTLSPIVCHQPGLSVSN